MKKTRKWLQEEAIQQRERQPQVKTSELPRTISDLQAFNFQSRLTLQAMLKYKKIPLSELKDGEIKKTRKWLQHEAIQ
jgi:arsenate reductase-like glutaredoxin family protein